MGWIFVAFLNNRLSNYSKWIKISIWLREHSSFNPSLNEAFRDSNSSFYFSKACFFWNPSCDPHSPREPLDAQEGIHQRGKKKIPSLSLSEPKKKRKRENLPSLLLEAFSSQYCIALMYFGTVWSGYCVSLPETLLDPFPVCVCHIFQLGGRKVKASRVCLPNGILFSPLAFVWGIEGKRNNWNAPHSATGCSSCRGDRITHRSSFQTYYYSCCCCFFSLLLQVINDNG